jgi:mannose-6-phosphate isomerase-like protein (cupin superfamily)
MDPGFCWESEFTLRTTGLRGTALGFDTKRVGSVPDAIAPDGSEVRVLSQLSRGGLALFSLPPNAVSKAVAHRTVEEIWYILSGSGRMWRKLGEYEEVVELSPGISLTIPTGTHFQFRCDGHEPLNIIGATMPPWPGQSEAVFVDRPWQPTM